MALSQPLSSIKVKDKAAVLSFSDSCPVDYRRRLMTMGLLPNTEIQLLRVAPLGDPIEIELRHSRLTLRKAEAACVLVEVLS